MGTFLNTFSISLNNNSLGFAIDQVLTLNLDVMLHVMAIHCPYQSLYVERKPHFTF